MKHFLLSSLCTAALITGACKDTASSSPSASSKSVAAEQTAPVSATTVIKSELDKRDYLYKVLDNGLKVVVVSDPDADKAAASLDVHIGHLADPADREGLSHFLEHMLFLGTGKYPEVGAYGKFIAKHGGNKNAGTGQEHTSYYFSINNDQLEPALDQFSRFFIDPLFDAEFVDKERNAVESEYSLKVKEDARRHREAVKQTANQDHPMTQFSVGNLKTLSDSDTSTILDAVKAQYDKYYSSDIMSLAIVGNYPAEDLMAWAETKFSLVPSRGDARDIDTRPAPYLDNQKGVVIRVNVLENNKSVRLDFAVPANTPHFKEKPLAYLRTLVTHRGEGTLYDTLKSKGYLKNLYVSTWSPDDYSDFKVNFNLTDEGYANSDAVIEMFFSYINLIRQDGIEQSRFEESAKIADQNFRYQDKGNVASFVRGLSSNLQYFPANHILDVGRTYENFDAALIKDYLDYMTPQNVRVVMADPDFESETREERYEVAYSMEPLKSETIEKWSNAVPAAALKLPAINPYIAEDLSVNTANVISKPEKAYDAPGVELWYMNENEFALPKASLNLRIYSPEMRQDAAYIVALPLHASIMGDLLTPESYAASQAGLSFFVSGGARSYGISIQGYNDKFDVMLGKILGQMSAEKIDEATFERIKSNRITSLENIKFARPTSQLFSSVSVETNEFTMSVDAQIKALKALDFETFKSIVTDIASAVEVEGLYVGNIVKGDISEIGSALESQFGSALKSNVKLGYEAIMLPEGSDFIRQVDIDHNDSTIFQVFEGDTDSFEEKAKYRLLTHMLSQRFFKSLRTEQQYGYVVSLSNHSFDQVPGMRTIIQSDKAHPSVLRAKTQEFLEAQSEYLGTLSDEEFKSQVDGLLSRINKKYDNIYAKGSVLNGDLINENYDFDARAKLTAAVNALSAEDLAAFYQSEILGQSRRSMTFWSIGKAHKDDADYDANAYDICKTDKCIFERGVGRQ